MNNDAIFSRLRESAWRRKLTEAEAAELRAWLAAHPEAREDWEAESALNAALTLLPAASVPSNFTARIMQAVDRETASSPEGVRTWRWNWQLVLPRVAAAMAVMVVGVLALHQYTIHHQRIALVKTVALVTSGQPVPSTEALENFAAIRRMSQPQHADDELLALLK